MESGKDAVPVFVKRLAGNGYVFGVELIVHRNPGAKVEVFAKVKAIPYAGPKPDNVLVDVLVRLVQFVANPRIVAVGPEKGSA